MMGLRLRDGRNELRRDKVTAERAIDVALLKRS